jgi:hypothetical protein
VVVIKDADHVKGSADAEYVDGSRCVLPANGSNVRCIS